MKIEYNNEQILKMLNDFSNCTNLIASCHFEKVDFAAQSSTDIGQILDNSNAFDANKEEHFCRLVQQCNQRECNNDCLYYMNLSKQKKSTVMYTCHAGLCEMVTPIIFDNIIVGYVMCGKFIDAEQSYSNPEKVLAFAKKHNISSEKLLALYDKLPHVSATQIQSALNILNICIMHILEKQFIQLKNSALIEQIHDYILENLTTELTVDKICRHFFINRQKLHAIFKQEYNIGIKHYIIEQRINKAQSLLLETTKTVEEIAYEVGFSNYNYFIRIFKKHTGLPPFKFRKST